MLRFESVGDILEKDQAKDDVLLLSGVHVVAERICHTPELRFVDSYDRTVPH